MPLRPSGYVLALCALVLSLSGPAFAVPVITPGPTGVEAPAVETFLVELTTGTTVSDVAAIARTRETFVSALRKSGSGRIGRTFEHLRDGHGSSGGRCRSP